MPRQRRPKRSNAEAAPPPPTIEGLRWGALDAQEDTEWLWPGAIPAHTITLLEGRKATGKSTILAAIAASATGGPPLPGWTGARDSRVLWAASEDRWESVVMPRLIAAGACLTSVAQLLPIVSAGRNRRLVLPDDLNELRERILQANIGLLILDPYISLAGGQLDMRVEQQARMYLEPLLDLCWETRATAILSRHLRKGQGGDAREAGLGSVAVSNCARSILRCDEHPHELGRSVISVVASNYGRAMSSQLYTTLTAANGFPRIDWCGAVDLDAETIAEGRGSEAERDEWHDADVLLAAVVGMNWVRVAEVQHRADQAGISPRMLRRAKARLRIPSRQRVLGNDHYWEWGPPRQGWPTGMVFADGGEGYAHTPGRVGGQTPAKPRKKPSRRKQTPQAPAPTHAPPSGPPEAPPETTNGEETTD